MANGLACNRELNFQLTEVVVDLYGFSGNSKFSLLVYKSKCHSSINKAKYPTFSFYYPLLPHFSICTVLFVHIWYRLRYSVMMPEHDYTVLTQPIKGPKMDDPKRYGLRPVSTVCQYCESKIITNTQFVEGALTYLLVAGFCLTG